MATSCSHWWHCPFYFAMSVILAIMAISASTHSTPNNSIPLNQSIIPNHLSFNASRALRRHGFNAIATLLQIYPEIFLSSPQSTIFAIPDTAISNASAHPNMLKQLIKYHTSPSKLPIHELLKKPQGTCLTTLVHQKNIAITKIDPKQGSIEINNVLISHPDLFLERPISIHGVLAPFSSLLGFDRDWEITQSPICESKNSSESKNIVEWTHMVRLLSFNGFVSFAIGLHSVLDGILRDHPGLNSVTIFAPPEFIFVASSWPLLDRIVRFHMVPERFTFSELASLPEKSSLRTLVSDRKLMITTNSKRGLTINGVEIAAPDIFSSEHFVIHGISRAFSMEELPTISI
ncbi:Fasciclin-like arabinogalactan protein 21 [Camellia lanceoleosa]|uniref:Fasciclin-like arabinogalactan protein 21 n=1 Tax=Camellia lanceoleosa TaxID=1840588 RepID=A0ACC0H6U1_9ERIC|nr:Fasciclin-like arabinogalactan protein 21 [Camellia lanceoleosa]